MKNMGLTKQVNFHITEKQFKAMTRAAERANETTSAFLRRIINDASGFNRGTRNEKDS